MHNIVALVLQAVAQPEIGIGLGTGAGVGGLGLAGVMFYFYRQERDTNRALTEKTFEALEHNTQAMVELKKAVESFTTRPCLAVKK